MTTISTQKSSVEWVCGQYPMLRCQKLAISETNSSGLLTNFHRWINKKHTTRAEPFHFNMDSAFIVPSSSCFYSCVCISSCSRQNLGFVRDGRSSGITNIDIHQSSYLLYSLLHCQLELSRAHTPRALLHSIGNLHTLVLDLLNL